MAVNGTVVRVAAGTLVVAVLLEAGIPCRLSVTGAPRTALCGMGICFECRAKVNGVPHRRTCQMFCADGMVVETEQDGAL